MHRFTATIGDRTVVTETKRKHAAKEEFDAAVQQGHTAVHLQQQQRGSLFSVEVGNLRAMEEAVVRFSYVRLLNSVAGAVEFEHQATWVPPYVRPSGSDVATPPPRTAAILKDQAADNADGFADAPTDDDQVSFSARVSYTLSYSIKVHSSRGFKSIESPSAITVTEDGPAVRTITLAESGESLSFTH